MISITIYGGNKEKPETKQIDRTIVTVGRGHENDIILDDMSVSKKHAEIYERENGIFISDLDSTNGTFVGERKIPALKEIPFQPDDIVTIGVFHLRLLKGSLKEPAPFPSVTPEGQADAHGKGPEGEEPLFEEELSYYRNPEVIELKSDVHERLLEIIDLRRLDLKGLSDEDLRRQCDGIVRRILGEKKYSVPEYLEKESLIKDILDEALGLGPLEDFLADPGISEIMVNRSDQIYVERGGRIVLTPKIFSSDISLLGVISRIVAPIGRRIDESSPLVDARLKDGSRVNVIIPPLALDGPCITIRKFAKVPLTTKNLVEFGSLTASMAEFIKTCVTTRKNIVVSGGTGSGKTTVLNIFSSFIPEGERIVTIEDAAELQLPQEHVVRMESRPPNIEGKGAIPIRDLVKNALRMRPDRIIVGECRGGEALDMLQAMNTGHDGSLTTGHANSPEDMLSRLETMVMMSGEDLPSRAIREQIAAAVDIIVQQTRFSCGSRKVTQISEVLGIEDDKVVLQDIFYFKQEGFDSSGKVKGVFMATGWIPDFYQELYGRGIDVDMSIFHNA
jgi:pilus assembly protein CpaF